MILWSEKNLDERNQLGKDEPTLHQLHIRRECQLVHHADQQGCHRQHHRQVHRDRRVEEVWQPEEGGGVADCDEEEGGEEGHEGLLGEPPLEDDLHQHLSLLTLDNSWRLWLVGDEVLRELLLGRYPRLPELKSHAFLVRLLNGENDEANLF